jgi:hypothetical protein
MILALGRDENRRLQVTAPADACGLRPDASNASRMRVSRNPLRIIESSLCGSMCGSRAR